MSQSKFKNPYFELIIFVNKLSIGIKFESYQCLKLFNWIYVPLMRTFCWSTNSYGPNARVNRSDLLNFQILNPRFYNFFKRGEYKLYNSIKTSGRIIIAIMPEISHWKYTRQYNSSAKFELRYIMRRSDIKEIHIFGETPLSSLKMESTRVTNPAKTHSDFLVVAPKTISGLVFF